MTALLRCGFIAQNERRNINTMPIQIDEYEITWYMHEICMHSLGAEREYFHLEAALQDDRTRQTRIV